MKKVFFVLSLFLLMPVASQATPPREMQVSYDPGTQTLDVKMKHITIEKKEHYIRTITLTVNKEEPKIFRYTFQKYPSEFEAEIPIALKPGDAVHIKAQCAKGGSAEIDFTVPAAK